MCGFLFPLIVLTAILAAVAWQYSPVAGIVVGVLGAILIHAIFGKPTTRRREFRGNLVRTQPESAYVGRIPESPGCLTQLIDLSLMMLIVVIVLTAAFAVGAWLESPIAGIVVGVLVAVVMHKIYGKTTTKRPQLIVARPVPSLGPDPGVIYVSRSTAHIDGLYKIGLTRHTAEVRMAQLLPRAINSEHFQAAAYSTLG